MYLSKITVREVMQLGEGEQLKEAMRGLIGKTIMYLSGKCWDFTLYDVGQFDASWRLHGEFQAANLLTGEVYMAEVAFLPRGLSEQIHDRLEKMRNEDSGSAIDFECQITVQPHPATGYKYVVHPVITQERLTKFAELQESIKGQVKLLKGGK